MNKCGLVSPHSSQPGYPWFAVLKQQVINPETGHKLPKIFHGGTIVSKKFIVTAAEIFYTDDTDETVFNVEKRDDGNMTTFYFSPKVTTT